MDERLVEHYRANMQSWVDYQAQNKRTMVDHGLKFCESPIEKYLLISMAFWDLDEAEGYQVIVAPLLRKRPLDVLREKRHPYETSDILIVPQFKVGGYRLDFLLIGESPYRNEHKLVAIECDGHDFHERTKGQAQRDRKRDRDLQRLGLVVFRFTGSEIFKNAGKCAADALEYIREWQDEVERTTNSGD